MNHGIFIIKVVENPIPIMYKEDSIIKIPVCFAKNHNKLFKNEISLILWGCFKEDFLNYYKLKDYLIIEGIITSVGYKNEREEVNLIAKRVYPFLLD